MEWIYGYVIGYFVSWYLISGMLFVEFQGYYPELAKKDRRSDLGNSIAFGFTSSVVWPFSLPVIWLTSGFAEYGVWKVKEKKEE